MCHRTDNLSKDRLDRVLSEKCFRLLSDVHMQVTAGAVLHNQVTLLFVVNDIVKFHDAVVLELTEDVDLAVYSHADGLIFQSLFLVHLHSNCVTDPVVRGLIDVTEGALAKQRAHLKVFFDRERW